MNARYVAIVALGLMISSDRASAASGLDDQALAEARAEVLDNSDSRSIWEDNLVGEEMQTDLLAVSYSKSEQLLVGEIEYRMGARLLPYKVAIDVSGATVPSSLQKGQRFAVVGVITFAALWGNVVEGCYLQTTANAIELDGF